MNWQIQTQSLGKRYAHEWVFRNLSCRFKSGHIYGVKGPNGSGKSTLLKVLSGHLSPSSGSVQYHSGETVIHRDAVFRHVSYTAPYIDMIEDLTMREAIAFHSKMRKIRQGLSVDELVDLSELSGSLHKQLAHFSSGMKQRLKLVLSICTDCEVLLLDEPSSYLDASAIDWYEELLKRSCSERIVIIASNEMRDLETCDVMLDMQDFKKKSDRISD